MMKKINILALSLLLGNFFLVSCDDETDFASTDKPVVSIVTTTYAVAEGEEVMITLTSDKPSHVDMDFKIDLVSEDENVVLYEDFEVDGDEAGPVEGFGADGYLVHFPANTTTFSFKVKTLIDDQLETPEVLKLRVSPENNMAGLIDANNVVSITITNKGSDFVGFTFSWEKSFDFGGATYSLCDLGYDNDFLLFADSGSFIDYIAATADCPEMGEVDVNDLGAGTYHILQNVYGDGGVPGAAISPAFSIPVTVDFSRAGSTLNGTYVQDAANAVDSDFPFDEAGDFLVYLVSFTVDANGVVTLYDDTTSATIGVGKSSLPKFKMNKNVSRLKNKK